MPACLDCGTAMNPRGWTTCPACGQEHHYDTRTGVLERIGDPDKAWVIRLIGLLQASRWFALVRQ